MWTIEDMPITSKTRPIRIAIDWGITIKLSTALPFRFPTYNHYIHLLLDFTVLFLICRLYLTEQTPLNTSPSIDSLMSRIKERIDGIPHPKEWKYMESEAIDSFPHCRRAARNHERAKMSHLKRKRWKEIRGNDQLTMQQLHWCINRRREPW